MCFDEISVAGGCKKTKMNETKMDSELLRQSTLSIMQDNKRFSQNMQYAVISDPAIWLFQDLDPRLCNPKSRIKNLAKDGEWDCQYNGDKISHFSTQRRH